MTPVVAAVVGVQCCVVCFALAGEVVSFVVSWVGS